MLGPNVTLSKENYRRRSSLQNTFAMQERSVEKISYMGILFVFIDFTTSTVWLAPIYHYLSVWVVFEGLNSTLLNWMCMIKKKEEQETKEEHLPTIIENMIIPSAVLYFLHVM